MLLHGTNIIVIDNVDKPLQAPSLAAALTADTWSDRILSRSEIVNLPQKAVWIVTGNNIRLGGDLPQRCFRIRLNANMPQPWQGRTFRHPNLLDWLSQHRSEVIAHLLTVIRAWFVAGKPEGRGPVLGSFEHWCRTIGGILEFAGIEGFLDNLEELYEIADCEGQQWMGFAEAWYDVYEDEPIPLSRLVDDLGLFSNNCHDEYFSKFSVLRESIPDDLEESFAKPTVSFKKKLGKALARKQDAHFSNGFVFKKAGQDSHKKVVRWQVVRSQNCGVSHHSRNNSQHSDIKGYPIENAGFAGSSTGRAQKKSDFSALGKKAAQKKEKRKEINPAYPARTKYSLENQENNAAGFETAPHTVTCAACDHYDGLRWCRNEISWNGARGQDRDLEHACEFFKGA